MTALHGFLGRPEDWAGLLPPDAVTPNWLPLFHLLPAEGALLTTMAEILNANTPGGDLIGYSMGGRIALHMLLDKPGLWPRAVIVSASPGIADPRERKDRRKIDGLWAARFRSEPWAEVLKAWNSQRVFFSDTVDRRPRAEADFDREALALALEKGSVGLQRDLRDDLRSTETEILWLAGERDTKYAKLAKECAALNPRFRYKIIPGAGHRVLWGHPEARRAALNEFLTE